jgi:hypothetical protein
MLSTNDQMASGSVAVTPVGGRLVDGGAASGGGAPDSANSENCESGCQFAIPSRHPVSVGAKRPLRKPSRTSFFRENAQTCCTPVNVDHGDSRRF